MKYKFQVGNKVKLSKTIMDEDLATVIKDSMEDIHIIHDTWLDTKEDIIKYKIAIKGWEFWFSEYELEEYKEEINEDCICRKEDDWDWYKLCIYKTNNKYYLQYPIEVYSEPLDVKIEIKYCPYCGRKLG